MTQDLPVSEVSRDFNIFLNRLRAQRELHNPQTRPKGCALALACTAACCARYRQEGRKKTFYLELQDEDGDNGSCNFVLELISASKNITLFKSKGSKEETVGNSSSEVVQILAEAAGQLALMRADDMTQERGFPEGEHIVAQFAPFIEDFCALTAALEQQIIAANPSVNNCNNKNAEPIVQ